MPSTTARRAARQRRKRQCSGAVPACVRAYERRPIAPRQGGFSLPLDCNDMTSAWSQSKWYAPYGRPTIRPHALTDCSLHHVDWTLYLPSAFAQHRPACLLASADNKYSGKRWLTLAILVTYPLGTFAYINAKTPNWTAKSFKTEHINSGLISRYSSLHVTGCWTEWYAVGNRSHDFKIFTWCFYAAKMGTHKFFFKNMVPCHLLVCRCNMHNSPQNIQ